VFVPYDSKQEFPRVQGRSLPVALIVVIRPLALLGVPAHFTATRIAQLGYPPLLSC
jgi:hypothetical protein